MRNAISLLSALMILISFATTVSGLKCPSFNIDCPVTSMCGNLIETGAGGGFGIPMLEVYGGGDSGLFGRFCDYYTPHAEELCDAANLSRKMTFTTDYTGDYGAIAVYLFANMSGAGEEKPMLIAGNCFFVYWGLGCTSESVGSSNCPRCVMGDSGVSGRFVQTDASFIGDHINIISGPVVSMDFDDTNSEVLAIKQQYERNPYTAYRLDTLKFSFLMGDGRTRNVNISIPEQCIPTLGEAPGTECTAVAGCPADEICVYGRCVGEETTECTTDGDCPIGMGCSGSTCVKRTLPIGHWTEETENGVMVTIQVASDGTMTVDGRPVQAITGNRADIAITTNSVTINGRPLAAEDGVLVMDMSDLPQDNGTVITAFGDYVVVFVSEDTALVFNRSLLRRVYGGSVCENACAGGDECCDGNCVNITNDDYNCGACGNECPANSGCVDKTCMTIEEMNDLIMRNIQKNSLAPAEKTELNFITDFINWLLGLFGLKW